MQERIDRLCYEFNGAIKYAPMLKDHPDWTDEQAIAFARKWHAVAIQRLAIALGVRISVPLMPHIPASTWNNGIPYCRNIATADMLNEARR